MDLAPKPSFKATAREEGDGEEREGQGESRATGKMARGARSRVEEVSEREKEQ